MPIPKKQNLVPCVDCHRPISPTTKTCGSCNSTDPFGVERADRKLKTFLFLAMLALGLVTLGVYEWKGITPLDIVRGDFQKLWQ